MNVGESIVRWLCRPNLKLFDQPLGAFRLHPDVLAGVMMLIGVYLVALSALKKRTNVVPSRKHRVFMWLTVATLLIAEVSPLHDVAEGYLFAGHMLQHLLLVFLLPPFMLASIPEGMLDPLVSTKAGLRIGKIITNPILTIFLGNAVYTIWHMPIAYQAALFRHEVHVFEHILMVGSAILMWWPIFSPMKQLPRLAPPAQILYLFLMSISQIGVFAYVTFANKIVYPFYASAPRLWNISPELDQVMAGVVMKLGTMAVIFPILVVIFFRWARREERGETISFQSAST